MDPVVFRQHPVTKAKRLSIPFSHLQLEMNSVQLALDMMARRYASAALEGRQRQAQPGPTRTLLGRSLPRGV